MSFDEAPADLPGNSSVHAGPNPNLAASMRPRQICRGIESLHEGRRSKWLASMRPRQICRGIPGSLLIHDDRCSFNEAPADLPGNCLPG